MSDHSSDLIKKSSAVTLSDMEIYIFPELMQALALANIMSPSLWKWRDDPWFDGIEKLSPYRRLLRVKQFIMDNYDFNLDLETWGLTTKTAELARFENIVEADTLARSNALFGYEGDKYYFSIDIRRHFGLDAYDEDVIPYWKTETIEAMTAFRRKPGYKNGAGECVSLAALYYAALFIVARIPLEKMYMLATPLHSQNFIDLNDGVITNNRRIVTKKMWFNGMELSQKARRALENEQVTFVSTANGFIHHLYPEATLDRDSYLNFRDRLAAYLETEIDYGVFVSFLRQFPEKQKCFQLESLRGGKKRFIEAEAMFSLELNSSYRLGEVTEDKLLGEVDEDEFYPVPLENRISLAQVKDGFAGIAGKIKLDEWEMHRKNIFPQLEKACPESEMAFAEFARFCRVEPRLPDLNKKWFNNANLELENLHGPEEIRRYLSSSGHPVAELALIAFRDISETGWEPFILAALERSPVVADAMNGIATSDVYQRLQALDTVSIYPESFRLAQPDEVWNFQTGDGLEKAIAMASVIRRRDKNSRIRLYIENGKWTLSYQESVFTFSSNKSITDDPPLTMI